MAKVEVCGSHGVLIRSPGDLSPCSKTLKMSPWRFVGPGPQIKNFVFRLINRLVFQRYTVNEGYSARSPLIIVRLFIAAFKTYMYYEVSCTELAGGRERGYYYYY